MRYLYKCNEGIMLEMSSSVQRHPVLGDGAFVASGGAGEVIRLPEPGHYLIRERDQERQLVAEARALPVPRLEIESADGTRAALDRDARDRLEKKLMDRHVVGHASVIACARGHDGLAALDHTVRDRLRELPMGSAPRRRRGGLVARVIA